MATAEPSPFLSNLSPADKAELFEFIDRHIQDSLRTNTIVNRLAIDSSRSEAVNEALADLTSRTGKAPEDVLLLALTFYEVALDASDQGQRVVLVDKDYRLVREVTGLGERGAPAPSPEKVAG